MKTIETTAVVGRDHTLTVQLPPDVSTGVHQVVVVLDENGKTPGVCEPLQFSAYPVRPISATFTFRREDLYDDCGS